MGCDCSKESEVRDIEAIRARRRERIRKHFIDTDSRNSKNSASSRNKVINAKPGQRVSIDEREMLRQQQAYQTPSFEIISPTESVGDPISRGPSLMSMSTPQSLHDGPYHGGMGLRSSSMNGNAVGGGVNISGYANGVDGDGGRREDDPLQDSLAATNVYDTEFDLPAARRRASSSALRSAGWAEGGNAEEDAIANSSSNTPGAETSVTSINNISARLSILQPPEAPPPTA